MRHRRYFIVLILISNLLSGCQIPYLLGRPKPAADMRVTDAQEISISNASIMDRSPDGRWLIVYTYPEPPDSEFCIYASEDLSPVFCMPESDESGIALQAAAWSPDSKKLALVEYMPDIPIDTDIWILNIETAHLEDITEDGVSGILTPDMDIVPFLDNAPAWSPDGIWVAFSRTVYNSETLSYETTLYKIPALGGDAERITKVSDEPITITNGRLAWLAGDRLIYTPRGETLDGKPRGLQVVSMTESNMPQPLEQLSDNVVSSQLLAVSPNSKFALLLHEMQTDLDTVFALPVLFNISSGASKPLKEPLQNDIPEWFARSNWVAFSPDSSKIGYLYESKTPTRQWRLALVDTGTEEEVVLKTFDARKHYINYPFRWGKDNVLMLRLVEEEPPFPIQLLTVK